MALRVEHDIFVVRQRGREVAAAVGLEHQDQVRLATALSEVGRHLLPSGGGADVTFEVPGRAAPAWPIAPGRAGRGPPGARRAGTSRSPARWRGWSTRCGVQDRRTTIRSCGCPDGSRPRAGADRRSGSTELRAELAASAAGHRRWTSWPCRTQQLIAALDEVRSQRDELAALNAELEETNRGVMALYSQLSEELEETNRGVVALYAELDEKSAQLRAASEAKSRFLANVSHELRAPVTAIIGLARLLADSASDPLTARAGPPGRADPGLRRPTCSPWSTTCSTWPRPSPAGSSRAGPRSTCGRSSASCAARCGRWPPAGRRAGGGGAAAGDAAVSDEVLLAQVLRNLLHNGAEVHRRAARSG